MFHSICMHEVCDAILVVDQVFGWLATLRSADLLDMLAINLSIHQRAQEDASTKGGLVSALVSALVCAACSLQIHMLSTYRDPKRMMERVV